MANPNHLPFVEWINSEEPLTPEQARLLREHLRDCETCRQQQASWGEVRLLFKATPAVSPAQGFAQRWQARLEQQRHSEEQRQRRQGLALIGILGSAAAILFLLLLSGASDLIGDPIQLLFLAIYRLIYTFSFAISLRDFALEFIRPAVIGFPTLLFPLIPGVFTLICVLWVVAIRTLRTSRRFVHENE